MYTIISTTCLFCINVWNKLLICNDRFAYSKTQPVNNLPFLFPLSNKHFNTREKACSLESSERGLTEVNFVRQPDNKSCINFSPNTLSPPYIWLWSILLVAQTYVEKTCNSSGDEPLPSRFWVWQHPRERVGEAVTMWLIEILSHSLKNLIGISWLLHASTCC